MSTQSPTRYLLDRFVRRRREAFAGSLALLLGALFLKRVPALLIGVALDALLAGEGTLAVHLVPAEWLPSSTSGGALLLVAAVGVAVVGESAAKWYGGLVYAEATLRTLHEVRVAAFDTAASLPMSYHETTRGGDTLSVLHDDVTNLGDLLGAARDGVRYGGEIVSAFAFMFLLNWNLALVVAVLPLAIAATGRAYATLLEPRYDAVRAAVGRLNVRLRDAIVGLRTVKAFVGEERERERVAAASGEYRDAKWSAIRLRAIYNRVSWLIAAVGIWGLFLLGGYWILAGPPFPFTEPLTPGTMLTFVMYTFAFLDPTRRLAVDVIDGFESAQASARRVVSLLRSDDRDRDDAVGGRGGDAGAAGAPPEDAADAASTADASASPVTAGRVEYDGVTFAYPGSEEPTLDGVSLTVEPGETVGIVGPSGAGKSTLSKLLLRFYATDAGTVRVDGRDVAEVDPRRLREAVGYVSQEPLLFHGTVAENVAYASPDASREEIEAAVRAAGAHGFVTDLPDGYDTGVGERGASLSGGQRQRLAIARALVGDPPILLLDEATSHVDNATELAIRERLAGTAGDRTTFAIAHRLSTVRDADRIVVLEDGAIVESGTHEELVARDGTYARLWRIQTGAVAAEDGEDEREVVR